MGEGAFALCQIWASPLSLCLSPSTSKSTSTSTSAPADASAPFKRALFASRRRSCKMNKKRAINHLCAGVWTTFLWESNRVIDSQSAHVRTCKLTYFIPHRVCRKRVDFLWLTRALTSDFLTGERPHMLMPQP